MIIKELYLKNFRNYREQKFLFDEKGAIVTGPNGVGKSNLLEAIAFFSNGKSIFGLKDTALVHFSESYFRLWANFVSKKQNNFIEAAVDNEKKQIKVDKILLKRISELYSYVKTIYFSPQDIQMIEGSPRKRRNYFDFAISQLSSDYVRLIRLYGRILQQRNALLKKKHDISEKEHWDKEFVNAASQITKHRLIYLDKIIPIIKKKYQFIVAERENIDLHYVYSFSCQSQNYQEALQEKIKKNEHLEKRNEHTLFGPHLADIGFILNEKPIRYFGSQGQKRCFAIAISLAQAELIDKSEWGYPILMFDDVLADLDSERTARSIELLGDKHQIFIATPHKEQYHKIDLPTIQLDFSHENE